MNSPLSSNPSILNSLRRLSKVRSSAIATLTVLCLFLAAASPLLANPGPLGVNGDWDWVNLTNGLIPEGGVIWEPIGSNPTVALDSTGWPESDTTTVIFDQRKNMPWVGYDPLGINENLMGTYDISFTGKATITAGTDAASGGASVQNQVYSAGTNQTTAQLVLDPGHSLFTVTFTNTVCGCGHPSPDAGFTNLVILPPGYSPGTTQIFTNETINIGYENSPNQAVRLGNVDAMASYQTYCTATTLCTTYWANRVLPTQAWQHGTGLPQNEAPTSQSYGAAWEYMVEFANQTNQDIWINVPISADDNYVTSLATLLLNGDTVGGVTYPGLNANRNVYVEYSNEVWNNGFPEYTWNAITASNAGITPIQQYVTRSIEIAKIFQNVFGVSGNPKGRVRPVIEWQVRDQLDIFNALQWWEQTNSDHASNYLYGVGDAPYFEPQDTSTLAASLSTMWTSSDHFSEDLSRQDTLSWRAVASYFGLNLTGYESGPSGLSDSAVLTEVNQGATLRDHAGIEPLLFNFYENDWFQVGGDLINYFQKRNFVNEYGYTLLSEDLDHYSFEENADYGSLNGQPLMPVTAGFILPWSVGQAAAVIDPSQFADWPFSGQPAPGSAETFGPTSNYPFIYLLRTSNSSTAHYSLTLYGSAQNSSSYVDVYLDDILQGSVQLPLTTGLSTAVTITIPHTAPPQQHTLQLLATGGQSYFPAGTGAINLTLTVSGSGTAMVPSAPMNLTAASGNNQASLEWAKTSTATAYDVERSTTVGGPYTQIAQVATNTYVDSTVTNGQYYYYVIAAVNTQGTSALSPSVSVFPAPAAAPATPTNLQITSNGGDSFGIAILTWSPVANAMGYNVYRGVNGGSLTKLFDNPQSGAQYVSLGPSQYLSNGSTYTFAVTAVDPAGESAQSSPVSTGTLAERVMQAPTNLTNAGTYGFAFLTWTPDPTTTPQYNTAFNLKRSTTSGGPYTTVVSTNTYNAYDFSAVSGTTYYYVVTETNNAGESAPSNQVSVYVHQAGSAGYKEGSSTIPYHY